MSLLSGRYTILVLLSGMGYLKPVKGQVETYTTKFPDQPYSLRNIKVTSVTNILRYEIYLQETVGGPLIPILPEYQGTEVKKYDLPKEQEKLELYGDVHIKVWAATPGVFYELKFELDARHYKDYLATIFGDPHVVLPIPGMAMPLCFEVTEDHLQVLEFISLAQEGLVMNIKVHELLTKMVLRKRLRMKPETFVKEVAILRGLSSIYLNTSHIVINNATTVEWASIDQPWELTQLKPVFNNISLSRFKMRIELAGKLNVTISRKSNDRLDISFSNLYIGAPANVQGVLGTIAHRITRVRLTRSSKGKDIAMLQTGHEEIQAESGRIGPLPCWKLYKAMDRVIGDDLEKFKAPYLFFNRLDHGVSPTIPAERTGGPMLLSNPPYIDRKSVMLEVPEVEKVSETLYFKKEVDIQTEEKSSHSEDYAELPAEVDKTARTLGY